MDSSPTEAQDSPLAEATMGAAAQKAGDTMVADSRKSGVEIKKLVVAIHGIGDQYRQATIQSVVAQFGHYFDFPATVPLGSFYSAPGQLSAFTLKSPPVAPEALAGIGFVEAYWADIPRKVQRQGYTIQESKAWARTIVERVRARYGTAAKQELGFRREDFLSASAVLDEMIETIAVLGNLLFLAEKAGILKFDLDTMLTSYLGDVQIVADFANYRAKILAQFNEVLGGVYDTIKKQQADPEIYIIAHSEGTVVAFMALLQAMCQATPGEKPPPDRPAWIERVRGFMTIGSPIDKHIALWPGMWDAVSTPGRAPASGPIQWRNYYDYGDPVGFELDTTRMWLRDPDHPWENIQAFQFRNPDPTLGVKDDFGFSRYFLPGAAHNDYWTDPGVFGHFIQTVIGLPAHPGVKGDFSQPPTSRFSAKVTSYVVPYLLVGGTLYSGVYLLFRSLRGFLANEIPRKAAEDCLLVHWMREGCGLPNVPVNSVVDLIFNVLGITCLLTAMTLAARIPRLTRSHRWQVWTALLFAGFAALYVVLVDAPRRSWLGFHAVGRNFLPEEAMLPTVCTLVLALVASFFAVQGGRMRVSAFFQPLFRGMRPLILSGFLTTAFIVIFRFTHAEKFAPVVPTAAPVAAAAPSLWPLLLGGAAFTYLWWLSALIFDLVFVWHRYIRHATLQTHLRNLACKPGEETPVP